MVRDDGQRALLFELDMAINRLRGDLPAEHPRRCGSPACTTTCCAAGPMRDCAASSPPRIREGLQPMIAKSFRLVPPFLLLAPAAAMAQDTALPAGRAARPRGAARRSFALGHGGERRPGGAGGDGRPRLRLRAHLDGVRWPRASSCSPLRRRAREATCGALSAAESLDDAAEAPGDGRGACAALARAAARRRLRLRRRARQGRREGARRLAPRAHRGRGRPRRMSAAPACSRRSARPRRSSACSARCGAS